MCRRLECCVEVDERLQLRQRLKCQWQSQAASLYRDAGEEALSMDRATCCDCASDTDHASQHLHLLKRSPTRATSLDQPFRKSSQCSEMPCWLPLGGGLVSKDFKFADDERPARDWILRRTQHWQHLLRF
jgi:hypothetical protein